MKLVEHVGPRLRALGHLVELALDLAGVADLDELVAEAALEEAGHRLAERGCVEAALVLLDVAAVLDDIDDARVRGGTADPLLLELLHQAGLGVAGRGCLELLPRLDVERGEAGALVEARQHLLTVVARHAADAVEAVEPQHAPGRLEHGAGVAVAASHAHGGRIPLRVGRLAGEKPLPDEPVELQLLVRERPGDPVRLAEGVGRPDRLVRLLGTFVAARVDPRRIGQVGVTEPLLEIPPGHADRLAREVRRVGSHVGDEAHASLVWEVDALVELLRDPHRTVGRHAQAAARGLLQRARDEGWIGP